MADWVKIALKTGLVVTIMVALWAVFTQLTLPAVDMSVITNSLGTARAVLNHFCPAFDICFNIALSVYGVYFGILGFKYAMIAVKWLFKVNE